MNKQTEALKLALEALESCDEGDWSTGHVIHPSYDEDAVKQAMIAIEEALAQQSNEQVEPVASRHYFFEYVGFGKWAKCNKETYDKMPKMERLSVYTHQPVPAAQPKEPEQEPVAWMNDEMDCIFFDAERPEPFNFDFWKPLYTTPHKRTWAGLTDDDKMAFLAQDFGGNRLDAMDWAEKRLKEKNT